MKRDSFSRRMVTGAFVGILCISMTTPWFGHSEPPAIAAESNSDSVVWEYAKLEFIGILPDAYSSYADYQDTTWRWVCSGDGVLEHEGIITGLKELYRDMSGHSPDSSYKDEHILLIVFLDVLGGQGWELADYQEQVITVNYHGLSNGGNQVFKTWMFKRTVD